MSRMDRFEFVTCSGKMYAVEKRVPPEREPLVFVKRMSEDLAADMDATLSALGTEKIFSSMRVAIKINIGGGVPEVPSSYTDLLVLEELIEALRRLGGEPFVCEADMRTVTMDHRTLARRGLYPLLVRKGVDFVNLSEVETVDYYPLGWRNPFKVPQLLLSDDVRIVSLPALKCHWECRVTLSQKNMYGALSERRKSVFHRGASIDETVAAAARALEPDLAILAHRQICGKLGPHFCVPVNFGYIIASRSSLAADVHCAGILGLDWRQARHLVMNSDKGECQYRLHPESDELDPVTVWRVTKRAMSRLAFRVWRAALYPQYFQPHDIQYRTPRLFEAAGSFLNHLFFHTRGDPWPTSFLGGKKKD